jgi:uncharacterized protein YdeI (YjbR/CyaY-like superfamily)
MKNTKVDDFLLKSKKWQPEMEKLRSILLDCQLTEDFKWKHPCYTYRGKNIIILHGFKEYCALLFFKGALLQDSNGILIQQTEKVQAARQLRFTTVVEIDNLAPTIKAYIYEAIEIENAGLKVELKPKREISYPMELLDQFKLNPLFEKAFKNLTLGRQNAYLYHFSEAKQSKTITARIEKFKPRILKGFGLNDCVCGKSKRMPNCDGSHKKLQHT